MAVKVNGTGRSNANALIRAGKVNRDGSWSFEAADGNALLGDAGDDWANYGKWFLATDDEAERETKDHYKYPFGKGGQVYRAGVIAIKSRAAQQGATDIADAADALLQKIDKGKEKDKAEPERVMVRCERDEAVVPFDEDDDNVPPAEFLIMPRPVFQTSKGTYIVDDESCAAIMADFARRGVDLLIDYEHQTLNAERNGQPAPAWGWFRPEVRDDGIYAIVLRWAEEAAAALKARTYRYHSPVFTFDAETRRVMSIEMESLVNYPASYGQVPLAAKSDGITVDDQHAQEMIAMDKKILETLGVKEESEAEPAIVALKASIEAGSTEIGALKAEAEKAKAEAASEAKIVADVCECVGITDRAALIGACKALAEKATTVDALAKELDAMKAERDAREKAGIIEALKVPAKTAEWLKDRDLATVRSFRDTLGSETTVVHTDVQSASAISTPPSIGGDGAEREVMYREWRRMGIAEDKLPARWEKYLAAKVSGK